MIKHKVKKICKGLGIIALIPLLYFLGALSFSYIPVSGDTSSPQKDLGIYLHTNGVHLDLILPRELLDERLLSGLNSTSADRYFSFGWGDKDFYLNTPHWEDLSFSTAVKAMFLKSSTLMHVSRYRGKPVDVVEISLNEKQLQKLNAYILNTFALNDQGEKIILPGKGYAYYDDFFEAKGNYSCLHTCNSWINTGLKESQIKACLWTPFDFALLDLHKK